MTDNKSTDDVQSCQTAVTGSSGLFITNECNMELMKRYPDNYFDLAIVDPPYGISVNKMTLGNGKNKVYRGEEEWDNLIPKPEYFTELKRVSKHQIIWGGNYMTEHLNPTGAWLFWDKGTGENDFADGELAWTSYSGALRKITKSWVGANAKDGLKRIHPTQKPIYLYEWIIKRFAKNGFKLLDTHIGSGSIAIAVDNVNKIEKMDLTLVGCEKDKGHYNDAMFRINENTNWQSLF